MESSDDRYGPAPNPDPNPNRGSLDSQLHGSTSGFSGYDRNPSRPDDPQPEIVLAAQCGDLFMVKSIVESANDDEGRRKLVNASRRWTEVDHKTSNALNEYEWHDETALLAAVAADCSEIVEYLLRELADPTLEACLDGDYFVSAVDIVKRRIEFRTDDTPETYLQNHNISSMRLPTSVIDTPLRMAKRVFKRAHGHLRSAYLLDAALKFWKKTEYSSSYYSKAREFSGYSNQPTDKDGLWEALNQVPPLPVPSKEILSTLVTQITTLGVLELTKQDLDSPLKKSRSKPTGTDSPNKKQKQKKKQTQTKTQKQKQSSACRFFAKGNCRYGDRCHFLHEKET